MRKGVNWKVQLGIGLVLLSVIMLIVHYLLFHNLQFLEEYVVFDLAFLPIEVVIVTLILDQLLEMRERQERKEKMNMVIGIFYSEVGVSLLRAIARDDAGLDKIRKELMVSSQWSPDDFSNVRQHLAGHPFTVDVKASGLHAIHGILSSHRTLLVQLLENPVLLEHEEFTNVLRAVFHLAEELDYRESLDNLPESDYKHLSGDISRAYGMLAREWLSYTKYLQQSYPYLFSLAMRTNPFDLNASPVVKS